LAQNTIKWANKPYNGKTNTPHDNFTKKKTYEFQQIEKEGKPARIVD